jgi:hypothetical protein
MVSFKEILTNVDDQILKGLILKVKNESMKKEIFWHDLRPHLLELLKYDEDVFNKVLLLVLNKKYKR